VKAASVRAPACYFAETTGEGEFFALLLEDFPNHRPGDETVGLKVEEARLAIDLMAQLHGPYWGKMAKVDLAPLVMPARDRYVVAWNEMEARFGEHVPDRFREAREAYLDAIVPLQQWAHFPAVDAGARVIFASTICCSGGTATTRSSRGRLAGRAPVPRG
jgi:hypothetical protein